MANSVPSLVPSSPPAPSTRPTAPRRWRVALDEPGLLDLRLPFVRVAPSDPRIGALRDALLEGDPLADALAERMRLQPSTRAKFELAVDRGLASVADPEPELAAFFEAVERVPPWLDRAKLKLGTETMLRVGPGGYAALGAVSLMSGYLASGAVKPLVRTGALTTMARRRLVETSKFVLDVSLSEDVGRFAPGVRAALRVRLIHAHVRAALLRSPTWRTDDWGTPINQHDMVATNLEFSTTYVLGLLVQGYVLTRAEREAVMHLWRYLGFLSGIREDLLPTTFREGLELLFLINRTAEGPDEDSRALARALLDATSSLHRESLGPVLGPLRTKVGEGLARFALGRRAADALGIPNHLFRYAPLALAPTTFAGELLRRAVPGARALSIHLGARFARDAIERALEGRPTPFAAPTGPRT